MKEHEGLWFKDEELDTRVFLWNIFGEEFQWLLDAEFRNTNIKSRVIEHTLYACVKDNKYKRVGPVEVGKW